MPNQPNRKAPTVYHVISKTRNDAGQATILRGDIESRDEARSFAKSADGTVKSDSELTTMLNDGKILVPQPTKESTDMPSQNPNAEPTDAGTQNTTAPETNGEGAPQNAEGGVPPNGSIMGAAEQTAADQTKRTTVGKKAKPEPKRVATPEDVLAEAESDAQTLAERVKKGELSKVDFVRKLALWGDKRLQRGDAIKLTAKVLPEIAAATVSTQFQFARSERMTEYTSRAATREQEAKARADKKAADEKARADAKAKREADAKAKADKKAADDKAKQEKKEADAKAKADAKAAEDKRKADEKAAKEQQQAGEQQAAA